MTKTKSAKAKVLFQIIDLEAGDRDCFNAIAREAGITRARLMEILIRNARDNWNKLIADHYRIEGK